ncbi:MAG: efflux RND transporter periplasmic adaptor subunit, partial [Hyphomicrobiales bacterium]
DTRLALDRARLELKQAEEALADRVLVAPFEGVVGIPKVEAGDRVTTGTAIVTIDDRSEILVEIAVPEEFVSRLEIGQKVVAVTPSFPERRFEGLVERIDSRIDPVNRTMMVRAELPNPDDELRPGMSFAVELIVPGKVYSTVAELALQWDKGDSYVWRIAGGKAEKVPVRSIRRFNREILVDGPLKDGDLVVVEGVQRLRPGRAVSFVLPDPAPGS